MINVHFPFSERRLVRSRCEIWPDTLNNASGHGAELIAVIGHPVVGGLTP